MARKLLGLDPTDDDDAVSKRYLDQAVEAALDDLYVHIGAKTAVHNWASSSGYQVDDVVVSDGNLWRRTDNDGGDVAPGLDQLPIWSLVSTGLVEPVIEDGELLGAQLPVSLVLNDHRLYLRNYGDTNHSIGWGWSRYGVDGPVLNGADGVGVAVGDAIGENESLVASFNPRGLQIGQHLSGALQDPTLVTLGDSYGSSTAGDARNTKLRLFDDNVGNIYGLGVSDHRLEYQAPVDAVHAFYVDGAAKLSITGTGVQLESDIAPNGHNIGDASAWDLTVLNSAANTLDAITEAGASLITAEDPLADQTITRPSIVSATGITVGTTTDTGSTTPAKISLGSSYGTDSAGTSTNLKLVLHDPGTTSRFGLGISADTLEYQVPVSTQAHKFFVGGDLAATIDSTGVSSGGVPVVTTTGTQALTNKDLSSGTNTFPTLNQSTTGSAATLTTGRTFQTNLASTSTATFNGSANVTPGVTGTLPVGNGGSGATSLTGLLVGNGTSAFTAVTAPSGAVVGTTDTQSLSNKTLTSPKINQIMDTNASTALYIDGQASAVNYFNVVNASSGGSVSFRAAGSDADIAAYFFSKGVGLTGLRSNNGFIFVGNAPASSVNYFQSTSGATGNSPTLAATGSDTNVDFLLTTRGSGVVKVNGVEVVTLSGAQALTNKTATSLALTGTTKIAQSGALELYSTSDQTTNYEKLSLSHVGSNVEISSLWGGTGSVRILRIGSGNAAGSGLVRYTEYSPTTPFVRHTWGGSGTTGNAIEILGTSTASSSALNAFAITFTANQSSTAGYTAALIDVTETATGSGTKNLISAQVGGTSKFTVSNTGLLKSAEAHEIYNTSDQTTNYEKLVARYNSNVAELGVLHGGSGTARALKVGVASVAGSALRAWTLFGGSGAWIQNDWGTVSGSDGMSVGVNSTFNNSSGVRSVLTLSSTISQSGTAGYTALLINPTENTTGSGAKSLIDAQVGGTSKFRVDSTGKTLLSSGATLEVYNTSDQTTNYEKLVTKYNSNVVEIVSQYGGSGTNIRPIRIGLVTAVDGSNVTRYMQINNSVPVFEFVQSTSLTGTLFHIGNPSGGSYGAASGVQTLVGIDPTFTQTGTAGYTCLLINPTESTTGSGAKSLIDAQVGGTSKFRVDSTGLMKSAAGHEIFNTSDQTTNYEKLAIRYNSNIAEIVHLYDGTAVTRALRVGTSSIAASGGVNRYTEYNATTPFIKHAWGGTGVSGNAVEIVGSSSTSSSTFTALAITLTTSQTSTAAYNAFSINITETTTGSGAKRLISAQVGGTDKFVVDNTGAVTAAGAITSGGVAVLTTTGTQAVSNKTISSSTIDTTRVKPRSGTTTSSATPTINTDSYDVYGLTAQAVDITSFTTNLSGTPVDGQKLWIYIVGTAARAITWGASFESGPTALPTTTVTTQRLDVGFVWNAATTAWRCVAAGSG